MKKNSGYYIEDDKVIYIRVCDCCGKEMTEGYCIRDGEEYFCSDDCLHSTYSEEEYEQLCEAHEGYWTEWEE